MSDEKRGRPTKYNVDVAKEIVTRMAEGESLNSICSDEHIPSKGTVLGWVFDKREDFSDQYEKAMSIRAHGWAEDIVDISDNECGQFVKGDDGEIVNDADGNPVKVVTQTGVSHARLMTDNRKWIVSKLIPKFSDKAIDIVDDGEEIKSVTFNIVDASSSKRK